MNDPHAFQVRLGNYRLARLMPALCHGSHVSGTLMLERGRIKREFTFRNGDLVAASSTSPREHLSQVLTDLRILDVSAAAAAFAAAEAQARPYAQHLVSSGLVSRERLVEALEHKARECFFDCYTWDSGDLWFFSRRDPQQGVEICLELGALHHDAMARLEEWNRIRSQLPDMAAVLTVRAEAVPGDASPEARALLATIATGRTVQETLELSHGSMLAKARQLLELVRCGALEVPGWSTAAAESPEGEGEIHMEEARQAMAAADFERAVELSLRALRSTSAPAAHELYRNAEACLARELTKRVAALDGRLSFRALPTPLPPELTSDDLYLYSKLKEAGSLVETIRRVSSGEVAAARSLFRLIDSGAIAVTG